MYIQSNSRARSIELLLARILLHFSFHFFPFLFFYRFRFNFFFFSICVTASTCLRFLRSRLYLLLFFSFSFFFFLFFISFFCSWLHTTFVPFVHPVTNSQLVPFRDGPNAQKTRPRRKKRERTERFRSGVIEVSIQ